MTTEQLKLISNMRINSAETLMKAGDWFFSAYTMAMALECALKAMICKTLNLSSYPEDPKHAKIRNFFWTHEFEQLLILSGLSDTFSPSGQNPEAIQSWSEFTKEFSGSWSETKYSYDLQQQFDKIKVERLYENLTSSPWGIITKIKEKW
ncbi:MAG TPA: hypothetical protein VK675_00565 [Candidatus Paceibacterota bacterium]|nr:hypothetical protein [Candidatus Paceibacterota bacterium]